MRSHLFVVLAILALGSGARGDTLTFGADRDNTLYEDPTGGVSNGIGESFFVGRTAEGALRRGLVRFDLSGIPSGSVVTGVTLTLRMTQSQAGGQVVGAHRVTADWGEGASNATQGGGGQGAPSEPGDATWIHRFFSNQFWAASGGDFDSSASDVTTVSGEGNYEWSGAGMVADVQGWIDDPAANFGWLMLGNEGADQTTKRFASRENANGGFRPELRVEVDLVPVELTGFSVE